MEMSRNGESGFYALPEGCIADVISLTTPRIACELSLVSKLFHSAAESDTVWEKFLMSDYRHIIARSINPSSLPHFSSTKDLYLHLSDHPLIIDGGNMSFSLEKWSGKKSYMLAARSLDIIWGDTPQYWKWTSRPDARFDEVVKLLHVWWLEIHGSIRTCLLSSDTNYAAYLVYKLEDYPSGFDEAAKTRVYLEAPSGEVGTIDEVDRYAVLEETSDEDREEEVDMDIIYPQKRKDGWLEVELGEYFNKSSEQDEDGELKMSLMEVDYYNLKEGLIVQGIEIRPKEEK